MELDKLVTTFGLLSGLAIFSWPYLMKIVDKMTNAKALHMASEDRLDEAQTGLVDKAFTQNAALQDRLFDVITEHKIEMAAEREILNAFGDELRLASERVVVAVDSLKNVLVHVGDMDVRTGSYFKTMLEKLNTIESHIRKDS